MYVALNLEEASSGFGGTMLRIVSEGGVPGAESQPPRLLFGGARILAGIYRRDLPVYNCNPISGDSNVVLSNSSDINRYDITTVFSQPKCPVLGNLFLALNAAQGTNLQATNNNTEMMTFLGAILANMGLLDAPVPGVSKPCEYGLSSDGVMQSLDWCGAAPRAHDIAQWLSRYRR